MALSLSDIPFASRATGAAISDSVTLGHASCVDIRLDAASLSLTPAARRLRCSRLSAGQATIRFKPLRHANGSGALAESVSVISAASVHSVDSSLSTALPEIQFPSPSPVLPFAASESGSRRGAKKNRRKGRRRTDEALQNERACAGEGGVRPTNSGSSESSDAAFLAALTSLAATPLNEQGNVHAHEQGHDMHTSSSDARLAALLGNDSAWKTGLTGADSSPESASSLRLGAHASDSGSAGAADVAGSGKAPQNAGDPYGKRVLGRAVVQWMSRGIALMAQDVAEREARGEEGLEGLAAGGSMAVLALAHDYLQREPKPDGEQQRCHVAMNHYPTVLDHLQRELQAELKRLHAQQANTGEQQGKPAVKAWNESASWNLLKQLMRSDEHRATIRQPISSLAASATASQTRQTNFAALLSPSALQAAQQRINAYVATATELLQLERDAELDAVAAEVSNTQPTPPSDRPDPEAMSESARERRRKERGEVERGLAREGGTLTDLVAVGTSTGLSGVHLITLASPSAGLLSASTLSPGDAICLSPDWSKCSRIGSGSKAGARAAAGATVAAVCYRGYVHEMGEDGQSLVVALDGKLGVGSSSGTRSGGSTSGSESEGEGGNSGSGSGRGASSPLYLQELFGVALRVQRMSGLVDFTTFEALERLKSAALKPKSPARAVAAALFAPPRAAAPASATPPASAEASGISADSTPPSLSPASLSSSPSSSPSPSPSASSSHLSPSSLSFDASQLAAIHLALDPARPVVAIQGPPGTGKTSVVTEIISRAVREGRRRERTEEAEREDTDMQGVDEEEVLEGSGGVHAGREAREGARARKKQQHTKKHRVLVSAPTNAAVDVLVERLASQGLGVARVGNPMRLSPAVTPYSLDHLVAARLRSFHRDVARRRRDLRSDLRAVGSDSSLRSALQKMLRRLARVEKQREKEEVAQVLGEADVILCTTTGAGERVVQEMARQEGGFDLVVLDEAGQATEPSSWIPLLLGRRAVVAGDPWQLAPTVQSVEAQQRGLGVSLMERIQEEGLLGSGGGEGAAESGGEHSEEMYHGQLMASPAVATRTLADIKLPAPPAPHSQSHSSSPSTHSSSSHSLLPLLAHPMLLIDTRSPRGLLHEHCEEAPDAAGTGSLVNEGEADLVVDHVARLLSAGVPPGSIAVQSPYLAQVQHIRQRLEERLGGVVWPYAAAREAREGEEGGEGGGGGEWDVGAVEVASVDSFQGREADAVIISMVRSNPYGSVGFLGDRRRMNVAVTRGRRHVAVVADSATVGHNSFLRRLLLHIRSVGRVVGAHDLDNLDSTPATPATTATSAASSTSAGQVYVPSTFSPPPLAASFEPVYSSGRALSQSLSALAIAASPTSLPEGYSGALSAPPKSGASTNPSSMVKSRAGPLGPRVVARLRKMI
ncbi:unnamed protein product [Closterium sp. NIES-53]